MLLPRHVPVWLHRLVLYHSDQRLPSCHQTFAVALAELSVAEELVAVEFVVAVVAFVVVVAVFVTLDDPWAT